MKNNLALAASLVLAMVISACAHSRVKTYQSLLDPLLGTGKIAEVSKILGTPVSCETNQAGETCEYRTSAARNDPIPEASRKQSTFGPDLSPYDYFDVLAVHYDGAGIMKDWEPVVIKP